MFRTGCIYHKQARRRNMVKKLMFRIILLVCDFWPYFLRLTRLHLYFVPFLAIWRQHVWASCDNVVIIRFFSTVLKQLAQYFFSFLSFQPRLRSFTVRILLLCSKERSHFIDCGVDLKVHGGAFLNFPAKNASDQIMRQACLKGW